ncbi:MAG TPA: DUF2272 domain-containing protein [Ramlibacter sp.]|jgi:hypothetical protein|nr:DUF2272 domain-containing protein [Ramlibacter sp.]
MTFRLLRSVTPLLLCTGAVLADANAATALCTSTARRAPTDARIRVAIEEARRQHELFGGQTIERSGGLFRLGHNEAESTRNGGQAAWERVAGFWRAVSEGDPAVLTTSIGRMARSEAARAAASAAAEGSRLDVAVRESLLRAAIVDTPWSAAFISHVIKTAGFSRAEFEFSGSHADYVRAALDASAAEPAGRPATHAWRACDLATTRPRAGDLLCATRASTAGTGRFEALSAAMAARSAAQGFPMHCDLVVRSDEGGDAKLEIIGGNVVHSVTLSHLTLNARKVLSDQYISDAAPRADCPRWGLSCGDHLSRRPWLVLLQFRH